MLAVLAVLAVTVKAYGSVQPLVVAGFGPAARAQATVTLRAIGAEVPWAQALGRFLSSSVHAGVLTGGLILALSPATRSLRADVAVLGLSLYALTGATVATMAVLSVIVARLDAAKTAHIRASTGWPRPLGRPARAGSHRQRQCAWAHVATAGDEAPDPVRAEALSLILMIDDTPRA